MLSHITYVHGRNTSGTQKGIGFKCIFKYFVGNLTVALKYLFEIR